MDAPPNKSPPLLPGTVSVRYRLTKMDLFRWQVYQIEVTEAGLTERTDVNESLHRWTGFHKLIWTRNYFYIFVTDAIVHVVPKRAFDSEKEARVFQTAIERR